MGHLGAVKAGRRLDNRDVAVTVWTPEPVDGERAVTEPHTSQRALSAAFGAAAGAVHWSPIAAWAGGGYSAWMVVIGGLCLIV